MSGSRRGMTLLEVVIAVALLAVLTVTVLPLLVDATRAAAPRPHDSIDPAMLRAQVEEMLAEEGAVARLRRTGEQQVALATPTASRELRLRWIPRGDSQPPHDWVEATCESTRVLHYVPRPRRGDGADETGDPASEPERQP